MRHARRAVPGLGLALAVLAGCAQVPQSAGFPDVQRMVEERADYRIGWRRGTAEDEEADAMVRRLLGQGLTARSAVQVALLSNRTLQASYEDLGISQAEVVQAGLLRNPSLFGQIRFLQGHGEFNQSNLEFEGALDFLDLLMIPARKQMAEVQFLRAKLLVGSEVLRLVSEVQSAYYAALWAEQVARMKREIAKSAETSHELARRLHEAGNESDLGLANHQGAYESARIEWAKAEAEAYAGREKLNVLMGLWGKAVEWKFEGNLPDLPNEDFPLDRLEAAAVEQRLDLAVARQESDVIAHALSIARQQGGISSAEVGVSAERETHGGWIRGPFLKLELPIFHQGQPGIARLEAQLRQAERRHEARAIEIRAEVRELRHRLAAQRNLAKHYREVLIPVRERIVALTLERYNYMLTGVFELFTAKREELEAYHAYLEAVRDYWIVRSKLQLTLGGRFPGEKPGVRAAAGGQVKGGEK